MAWLVSLVIAGLLGIEVLLFARVFLRVQADARAQRDVMLTVFRFATGEHVNSDSGRPIEDEIDHYRTGLRQILLHGTQEERARIQSKANELSRNVTGRVMDLEAAHFRATELIQVFPWLGILGTVLALYTTMSGSTGEVAPQEQIDQLMNAFGDALWTTILGLLAAVVSVGMNAFIAPRVRHTTESRREFEQWFWDLRQTQAHP